MIAPRKLKNLAEPRTVRMLSRGGILVSEDGRFLAYRSADRRAFPVGVVAPHIVRRLQALGHLEARAALPPRLVWTGPVPEPEGPMRPVAAPVNVMLLARPKPNETLLARLLRTTVAPGDRTRLWAAAHRFNADVEQAATPQPMTMRWDGLPVIRQRASGRGGGPRAGAAAALSRLTALEAAIGLTAMRELEGVLVQELTLTAFARAFGYTVDEAAEIAGARLVTLATTYDLAIASPDREGRGGIE